MRLNLARTTLASLALVALHGCATQHSDINIVSPRDDASVNDVADDAQLTSDAPPTDNGQPGDEAQPPIDASGDDASGDDAPVVPDDTSLPIDSGRCTSGLSDCAGSCRDLAADPANCGICGRSCASGQGCAAGSCACPSGQSLCASTCRDTSNDPMNCGACDSACPSGQSCSSGACTLMCPSGQTNCSGACTSLLTDRANCGACGRPCPPGNTCVASSCVAGTPGGAEFRVQWLGSTNCRSTEHASITGADRGGIALANAQVFYTGQTATGRFNAASLDGVAVSARFDAIVSNLRTGVVYTFADASGAPLAAPGAMAVALREIDASTGALTPRSVRLSAPINIMGAATTSTVGFFSGWDRLVVLANGRAYDIDLPSGNVIDLGSAAVPAHALCNAWGFWGVAEFASGIPYIVYVSDMMAISRRPLPMGPVTPVSQFSSLGNMCGFTLAPGAQRWYFHHSRGSQLGGSPTAMETIGYCDASTSIAGPTCPPDATNCGGLCRNVRTDAMNCGACNNACGAGQSCMAGACVGAPMNYMRVSPPTTAPFVDACTAPGHTSVLPSTDDSTSSATMPFDFRFWGAPVAMGSPVTVSSNGYLHFGAAVSEPLSGTIPATSTPNALIAVEWKDLVTNFDGICIVTTGAPPNRSFVVHWSNVHNYPSGGTLNFEAVLNESGATIDLLYTTMTGAAAATAGLENQAGSAAIGACPGATTLTSCVIPANTRWRFVPSP